MTKHFHVSSNQAAWNLCEEPEEETTADTMTLYFTPAEIGRDLTRDDLTEADLAGGLLEQVTPELIAWHSIQPSELPSVLTVCRERFGLESVTICDAHTYGCRCDEDNERIISTAAEEPGDIAPDAYIATATAASEAVRNCNSLHPLFAPSVQQNITICIDEPTEPAIFAGLRADVPGLPSDILTRYCDMIGLPWGACTASARFIEHGNGKGHYVVSGAVSARIGHELEFLQSCTALLFDEAKRNA